jgi:hypothetical protein
MKLQMLLELFLFVLRVQHLSTDKVTHGNLSAVHDLSHSLSLKITQLRVTVRGFCLLRAGSLLLRTPT